MKKDDKPKEEQTASTEAIGGSTPPIDKDEK
jgi:hypothetical protein